MVSVSETISIVLCIVSLVLCLLALGVYRLLPGAQVHPNQIIIHRVFADIVFSVAFLSSTYLKYNGDEDCGTPVGVFTSLLTQYSLFASELCYFFLAIDGLIAVSRPFSNLNVRYTFYGVFSHFISIVLAVSFLLLPNKITGRHVSGICWIGKTSASINLYSWIYMYIWIIIIYISSCVLLACMASCLNRLPIYHEELLQYRACILEKMMFYVFVFIVFGLSICILYSLIEMINFHFQGWTSQFTTTTVLQSLFFWVLSSRGMVTAIVFIENTLQSKNALAFKEELWTREVQPLLNTVIRRQLLDIFSRGVRKSIESSTYPINNDLLFMEKDGRFNDITTSDRYYDECNVIDIQTSLQGKQGAEESDHIQFVEYAPLVFSYLRWLHGVDNRFYMNELDGLSDCAYNEGSSGSLFVKSNTQRYIIKFVNKSECMVLKEILKDLTLYLTLKKKEFYEYPLSEDDMQRYTEVVEGESYSFAPPSQNVVQDPYSFSPASIMIGDQEISLEDTPFVRTAPSCSRETTQSPYTPLLDPETPSEMDPIPTHQHANSCCISPTPTSEIPYLQRANSYDENMHAPQTNAMPVIHYNQVVGSFLNKYYGMYSLEVFGSTVYFVVMENILPPDVNEVYDLKGSWVERNSRQPVKGQFVTCQICKRSYRYGIDSICNEKLGTYHKYLETKKDNNFRSTIMIDQQLNQQISSRLREDAEFLCCHGLMDYSVLLGIKNVQIVREEGSELVSANKTYQIQFATKVIEGPGLFHIGIIDYLQKYTIKKKLERFWKCIIRCYDSAGISDVPPLQYRDRIIERVMGTLFLSYNDISYSRKTSIEDYDMLTQGHMFAQVNMPSQVDYSILPIKRNFTRDTRSRNNSTTTPIKQDSTRSHPGFGLVNNHSSHLIRAQTDYHLVRPNTQPDLNELGQDSSIYHSSSSRHSSFTQRTSDPYFDKVNLSTRQSENESLDTIEEMGNDLDVYCQTGIV